MPGPRKQLLLKIGVFLLLGAIVNVAVAWVCVLWMPLDESPADVFESRVEGRPWWTSYDWFVSEPVDDLPTVKSQTLGVRMVAHGADLWGVVIWRGGWPVASIEGAVEILEPTTTVHCGIQVPDWLPTTSQHRNILPLKLIPLGFAIDAFAFAAILWAMAFACHRVHRVIRVRRGCCPACGYKIAPGGGIGPRCSECGHELRKVETSKVES